MTGVSSFMRQGSVRAWARGLAVGWAGLAAAGTVGAQAQSPAAAPAAVAASAQGALHCGVYAFPYCKGDASQFASNFRPGTGFGGFGGGVGCTPRRTPVVFVHGNADSALGWDAEVVAVPGHAKPARSVYDSFIAAGYQPCELYGVTYLTKAEQAEPKRNYHEPKKYRIVLRFIDAVKQHTGAPQVDIVAHSLGVSMTLAALTWQDTQRKNDAAWRGVRRFVNIAGGVRGLGACAAAGPANPMVGTCGAENVLDAYVFGFYPDSGVPMLGRNRWTAASGERSLRTMPARHAPVRFYTVHAGAHDQVHCSTLQHAAACTQGALFEAAPNVMAQLNVGAGATAGKADFNFADRSAFVSAGGDADGVGHFKARNQTGAMLTTMLTTDCRALACKGGYNSGPAQDDTRAP